MAVTEHLSAVDAVPPTERAASLSCAIKALAQRIKIWANSCTDYYAAAAMYEQLSRLSNAELYRRRLSRDTLGWHVCQSCDRAHR
jgi:hypothetical protein